MEDNGKYLRLFGTIFFSFLGFIIVCILVLLGLRLFFGLLNNIPWFVNIFTLFILCVPAALFITVYIIYFKRTRTHPSAGVRWISYILFTIALACWGYFLIRDLVIFFTHYFREISEYMSYDMVFLASNVFCIFLVGIIQALSMPKEQGWMEKRNDSGGS